MPASSIREAILADVVTTLQGITIANGFTFDMAKVVRDDMGGTQLGVYPGAIVGEVAERIDPQHQAALNFHIDLIVETWHQYTGPDRSTVASRMMTDIERALLVDPNRGVDGNGNGNAIDTKPQRRSAISLGQDQSLLVMTQIFDVHYRHLRADYTRSA